MISVSYYFYFCFFLNGNLRQTKVQYQKKIIGNFIYKYIWEHENVVDERINTVVLCHCVFVKEKFLFYFWHFFITFCSGKQKTWDHVAWVINIYFRTISYARVIFFFWIKSHKMILWGCLCVSSIKKHLEAWRFMTVK